MDECVSVIIPTYNRKVLLRQAIDSVLNQTYKNIEIIVSDDASDDGTDRMINEFYLDKVVYIEHDHVGVSQSRNLAIKKAKCDYLAFLDDDDFWDETFVEESLKRLRETECLGVFSNYYKLYSDGMAEIGYKKGKIPAEVDLSWMLKGSFIDPSTVLLKKSALYESGMFDSELLATEDWDLWLRVLRFGNFCYMDRALVYKRIGSSLNLPLKTWINNRIVIDKFCSILTGEEKKKLEHVLNRTRARIYSHYAMASLHQGDKQEAREYFRKSFLLRPSLKTACRFFLTHLPISVAVALDGSYIRQFKRKN